MKKAMPTLSAAALSLLLLLSPSSNAREVEVDWKEDLTALLSTEDAEEQEERLGAILEAAPEWREVVDAIRTQPHAAPAETGLVLRENLCSDGVSRPYVLFIPESYDPQVPTPLLVALHGGVGRGSIVDDPLEYAEGTDYCDLARERGMLAIWPMGQRGATWWDRVGIENVQAQIRSVKRRFNVDDDRVFPIGYSDGASGIFAWAMLMPSDFAAFIACSGHIGVGNLAGGLPTFASNLAGSPLYAVTSFDDSLYPSREMRIAIDMALEAGGDILYREQEGPHNFSYVGDELPLIVRFLDRHPRDPFPPRISWESAGSEFARCHWLIVDSVATDSEAAPWHAEVNCELESDRITIGFTPDSSFEGIGMRIDKVTEDSFASEIELLDGDIIVRADDLEIAASADLSRWKAGVSRGDEVEFEVLRGEERVVLSGSLPPVEPYSVFKELPPSARARAACAGNRVTIETSRAASLGVRIAPEMFRLEREITITVDGEELFRGLVEADLEFLLRNFLDSRDRSVLPVAELRFQL
jgi:hypothetical protein